MMATAEAVITQRVLHFSSEAYSVDLLNEMMPLWKAHFKELAHFKDVELDPDFEMYQKAWDKGIIRIFTARDGKKLVGYNVFVVNFHAHYRTFKSANQDIIYLDTTMRKGLSGYRFMKWSDKRLADEGVQSVYQHPRIMRNWGPLLERMGYKLMDLVYAKRLDQEAS